MSCIQRDSNNPNYIRTLNNQTYCCGQLSFDIFRPVGQQQQNFTDSQFKAIAALSEIKECRDWWSYYATDVDMKALTEIHNLHVKYPEPEINYTQNTKITSCENNLYPSILRYSDGSKDLTKMVCANDLDRFCGNKVCYEFGENYRAERPVPNFGPVHNYQTNFGQSGTTGTTGSTGSKSNTTTIIIIVVIVVVLLIALGIGLYFGLRKKKPPPQPAVVTTKTVATGPPISSVQTNQPAIFRTVVTNGETYVPYNPYPPIVGTQEVPYATTIYKTGTIPDI